MSKSIICRILLVIILGTALVTSGCGQKQEAASSEVKPIVFKIAHVQAIDHPYTPGVKKLAAEVKEKSKGRLILEDYPASQLGSEKDNADGVGNNILDMAVISPGEMAKRYKPISIFDAPYAFRDVDHVMKVVNGPVGEELWKPFAEKTNIKVLSAVYYGKRQVTSSKLVRTPADMKGLKLRTPDTAISVAVGKAMGASPTPMAVAEVYLALQQGVVDGQENPIPTIIGQKFNEVQKYLVLTGHVIQTNEFVISDKKFKALPPDLQKILVEAVQKHAVEISKVIADMENSKIEDLKKGGMQVIEPDVAAFRQATSVVVKQFENDWGVGLFEKIQAVK